MNRMAIQSVALVAALVSAPAWAGLHYQATQTMTGAGKPMKMNVDAWVEGDKAKVVFTESNQPMMEKGSYLLTQDGGKSIVMVNPKDKTYMVWDPAAMMQGVGAMMEGMRGMMSLEVLNPKVEKLLEEPGGDLLGRPTTHYRYRTTYTMAMKIIGMKRESQVDSTQDMWTTTALTDMGLGAWLRKDPPKVGYEPFDKLVRAEMGKAQGFPLKMTTVTKTTSKGKTDTSTVEMVVVKLEDASPGAETFALPAGYEKIEMPMLGAPPR